MKYEEMSDFDVNKLALTFAVDAGIVNNVGGISELGFASKVLFVNPVGDWSRWDGCNNASDAWPIVTASKIGISPVGLKSAIWRAEGCQGDYEEGVNPLRTAMICFLKMKEAGDV